MATFLLPSNVEAERTLLGSILLSPEATVVALSSLTESDFSGADPRNPIIFKAMQALYRSHRPIDVNTLIDELIAQKQDQAVPTSYLYELVNAFIMPENVDYYIEMVHEQAVLRELLLKMKEIQEKYAKGVPNIGDFVMESNDAITAIAQKRTVQGMRQAGEVAKTVQQKVMEKASSDRKGLIGVSSGFRELDAVTHGWQNGDLIILAARPAVGKTALGMNFVYNAALYSKVPVAFFSLEMSAEKVMERLIASRSNVNGEKIQTGAFLTSNDKVKISSAVHEISDKEIYFDDTPNSKLGDIVSKAVKLKSQHPNLGLIVVDYLGRIRLSDRASMDQRQQEVSIVSGELKTLARRLNVPVICLAQLNRDVEKTESKKPTLSHLRESGSIEQDADIVMLMYRPGYYADIGQTSKKKGQEDQQEEGEAAEKKQADVQPVHVFVAKNRNGSTKDVELVFELPYSRFNDPSKSYQERSAQIRSGQTSVDLEDD